MDPTPPDPDTPPPKPLILWSHDGLYPELPCNTPANDEPKPPLADNPDTLGLDRSAWPYFTGAMDAEAVPQAKDTVEMPEEAEVPAAASLSEDIVVACTGESEPEEPKECRTPDNEIDPLSPAAANRQETNPRVSGKLHPRPPCAINARCRSTKHPLNPMIISFILIVFHYPPDADNLIDFDNLRGREELRRANQAAHPRGMRSDRSGCC